MKHLKHLALSAASLLLGASSAMAQVEVNYEKYPDYSAEIKPDYSLLSPVVKSRGADVLPEYVNNAATKYFPPVFNQAGGSCGSASRIGYMFTYEMNAMRDADASLKENQYPTHFTWLLTNTASGKEGMAVANGIPNVAVYGGVTYSDIFGYQEDKDIDYGWMQGYDKWYSAMFNRIERNGNFPMDVGTEEGRLAVKRWLYNHNGDTRFHAGGICGIGVASGGDFRRFSTRENLDIIDDYAGTHYVHNWGEQVDHALTIVGYDDRIKFDLDEDGIYGEEGEVGAWIIVNSWGPYWNSTGIIYCPYSKATPSVLDPTGFWKPEVYYARWNYRPLRTFKIKMEYSHRSELKLSAGISSNLNATEPDATIEFEHFKFAGDGKNTTPAPAVPMLGKWNGRMNYEPMEFGYDLTDFTAGYDRRKPLKYFFIIESKETAIGEGKIHSCSLVDYEFDENGIETAFNVDEGGVTIQNAGNKTIISVVVQGEPLNAPRNVSITGNTLSWSEPVATNYVRTGYKVFCGGVEEVTLGADVYSYAMTQNGNYAVAAVYSIGEDDFLSTNVAAPDRSIAMSAPTNNGIHTFNNTGFTIEDIFNEKYDQSTIEYWIKPATTTNWNQQFGPGWGNFLCHTTQDAELVFGWSNSQRVTTSTENGYSIGAWQHIAIVVDGNTMRGYKDVELVGEVTGSKGIGGFGDLVFGSGGGAMNGSLDEVRIWKVARTKKQINAAMKYELDDPANVYGLLCYLKMDDASGSPLTDATGRHTVTMTSTSSLSFDNKFMKPGTRVSSKFTLPEGPYYVGQEIIPTNTSSEFTVAYEWTTSDAPNDTIRVFEPSFMFTTPGEKTISMKAYAPNGKTSSNPATATITVETAQAPVPAFTAPSSALVGQRVSFINTTEPLTGAVYEWTMTGADVESATTLNAAATYKTPGKYTVTLKATNSYGTATVSKTIEVANTPPNADFEVSPMNILKGGEITLIDKSTNAPSSWKWIISDKAHHYVYEGVSPVVKLDDAGVYDVTLTVGNDLGTAALTKKGVLVVANANSETGLNFTGTADEKMTFNNPVDLSRSGGFTIDWWMYDKSSVAGNCIGGSVSDFCIKTTAEDAIEINIGGRRLCTVNGVVLSAGWHHYAVSLYSAVDPTSNLPMVYADVYRDGEQVAVLRIGGSLPTMPSTFTLGGNQGAMNAVIDELRIWNKVMSAEDLRKYINQPIEDVASAKTEDNLALYYNFNEGTGSPRDLAGNNDATRTGFGPDGDAWSSSLGVFSLSDVEREDLSEGYLKNYKAPFKYATNSMNSTAEQYKQIYRNSTSSPWTWKNRVTETEGITTGVCVDISNDCVLVMTTKLDGFAGAVENHKFFQSIKMAPGHYVFGVVTDEKLTDQNDFVVASLGGSNLPDTEELPTDALGYAPLTQGEVSFSIYDKDTTVSLGLLLNTRGEVKQHFRSFYIKAKKTNEEMPATSIDNVIVEGASSGTYYSIDGRQLQDFESLPAGVYIKDGKKILKK